MTCMCISVCNLSLHLIDHLCMISQIITYTNGLSFGRLNDAGMTIDILKVYVLKYPICMC